MRNSLLFAILFSAGAAWGQAYPARTVTILNGFPPCGRCPPSSPSASASRW